MADPEAPAKNYQIDALTTAVNSLVASNSRIEIKIDNQLVTKDQLEASLKVVGLNIQTVDDKYAPIKRNLSRITWVVIGVIVPLVVISIFQLMANVSPSANAL